ncbi:MAG: DUF4007 family protein [Acidobacteria bacterium]|nr:DUF4007 family protein [Acidobacteriota bacterium]
MKRKTARARRSQRKKARRLDVVRAPFATERKYRVSGHESFTCRYTWLPKAVHGLRKNPKLFADEAEAMVDLGVGKNMVRSIRFWAQAMGVVTARKNGEYCLTDFGVSLLGERGRDPFLEDIRTLWLLHWKLATDVENPLLAWDYLLNRWQDPELIPSQALRALEKEATRETEGVSPVTLEQHFNTFLHTYVPTHGRKGEVQEDNLDCPLVELEFIVKVGDRELDRSSGRREPIYTFNREEKQEITPELFTYCLDDFWTTRHKGESTMPFREVAHGHGSPGQIFKLPEEDIRARVELLAKQSGGLFTYSESANLQQIRKLVERRNSELLKEIYSAELIHA